MTVTNYQSYPQFPASDGDGGGSAPYRATGSISSPVPYLDVPIPATGGSFRFRMSNIYYDGVSQSLAIGLSADGGETFLNDIDNYDSYRMLENGLFSSDTAPSVIYFDDALLLLNNTISHQSFGAKTGGELTIDINPGSTDCLFNIMGYFGSGEVPTAGRPRSLYLGFSGMNMAATVAPTLQRINLMRVQSYGNGDCNPPTSGHMLSKGNWSLTEI